MELTGKEQFYELSFYTLAHQGGTFIHQHIVDAFTAQTAGLDSKPIGIVFSLAGLYLYLEKNYTGTLVQQMHMTMAKNKVAWPTIPVPDRRSSITVADVVAVPPGVQRDSMIRKWCEEVWSDYRGSRQTIIGLLTKYLQ